MATSRSIWRRTASRSTSAEFTRIPNDLKDVTPEQRETIDKMVERLEEFDDVQNVYTNMKPEETTEEAE